MSNTGKRVDMLRQEPAGKWYASRLLQLWNRNGRDSELSVDDVEQMVIQLRSPHADMANTILQADEMVQALKPEAQFLSCPQTNDHECNWNGFVKGN